MKNSLIWNQLNTLSNTCLSSASDVVQDFYNHLSHQKRNLVKKAYSVSNDCVGLGLPIIRLLTDIEKTALIGIIHHIYLHVEMSTYTWFILRKCLINSDNNNVKHNDWIVALAEGTYVAVKSLLHWICRINDSSPNWYCIRTMRFHSACNDVRANLAASFERNKFTDNMIVFKPSAFKCKCLLISKGTSNYIIE